MASTQGSRWIRLGLWLLPVRSLLGITSLLLRGPFIDPGTDPSGFAQSAAGGYLPAAAIAAIDVMLLSCAFLAVYSALTTVSFKLSALIGLLFSLAGGWFTMPLFGVFAFVMPVIGQLYLQGQTEVLQVVIQSVGPAFLVFALLSGICETIGGIAFGVTFWRTTRIPRWAIVLYVASLPLFFFAPPVPFLPELAGMILFGVAGIFVALELNRVVSG